MTRLTLLRACLACGTAAIVLTPATAAQSPHFTIVGTVPGPADLVKLHGSYAYIAAGPTLRIVDMTEVSAPKLVSTFTFPKRIWALAVSATAVYAADDWAGLVILDVTNPAAPRQRGSYKTLGQAWGLDIVGNTAVVANQMSGIDIIDVADPDKPVVSGTYFTEGYARDVAISGSLAYVIDQPSGFSVLDVSKRGPPTELSTQQSAQSPLIVAVSETSSGRRIASLVGGRGSQSSGVQVYDVSDPAAPMRVSTFKTQGRAFRVDMHGALAYVADGVEGLQVVDLSDPAHPSRRDSYRTVGPARDVAVSDSLVLVVVGETRKDADPRDGGAGVLVLKRAP
jgi:hypothetical protein